MGFAVLHINKASGNDAGMTAHIERTIDPKNADRELTFLNRRLVEYSEGVKDRTEAITHRLDTAGITRKIGTNQVRALRVMLYTTTTFTSGFLNITLRNSKRFVPSKILNANSGFMESNTFMIANSLEFY